MPAIKINELLVDEMTEEEKEEWCRSDPSRTFKYNQLTKRVSMARTLRGGCRSVGLHNYRFSLSLSNKPD